MFITYNAEGLVIGYSDKLRHPNDLQKGEMQAEIDMEFQYIACKENGLTFKDNKLLNDNIVIANIKE